MKKIIPFLILIFVIGASFSLSYNLKNIKDTGYPGETLRYQLLIINDENTMKSISIFIPSAQGPTVSPNNFNLNVGEKQIVNISYTIPINAQPGSSFLAIRINGQDTNLHLQVNVLRPVVDYKDIKVSEVRMNSIDPRYGGTMSVKISNPLESVNGKIILSTPFGNQTKDVYIQSGNSIVNFELKIPENTKPNKYNYSITILVKGIENVYHGKMNVLGYTICNIKKSEDSNIFYDRVKYEINNSGTKSGVCSVSTVLSSTGRLLLGYVSPGYKKIDSKITWDKNLNPGEKTEVSYEVDYYGIYIAIIIGVVVAVLYWFFSRIIIVKKSLIDYKKGRGFMDMKMQVKIKNTRGREIKNVEVLEHIPPLVREVKEFGTMKGEIVKRRGKRYIRWVIESLKPKEELFLSYKIRTSLEVIGEIAFDPTIVKWKEDGKEKESKSNILIVGIE